MLLSLSLLTTIFSEELYPGSHNKVFLNLLSKKSMPNTNHIILYQLVPGSYTQFLSF